MVKQKRVAISVQLQELAAQVAPVFSLLHEQTLCAHRDTAAGLKQQVTLQPTLDTLRPRERFLREQAIAGDPQACYDQLAALARAGVTHLRLVFSGSGEWSNERAQVAMTLFAREVLPACRRL